MSQVLSGALTTLLRSAGKGDLRARDQAIDAVYPHLRRIAHDKLQRERHAQTLQPTALVHEALLRLLVPEGVEFRDRVHFYATAARQIRRLLVDYSRRRKVRQLAHDHLSRTARQHSTATPLEVALLLDRLAEIDPRAAEVVDLRYWGGLGTAEISQALGVSPTTVQRDWEFARLWLAAEHAK